MLRFSYNFKFRFAEIVYGAYYIFVSKYTISVGV